MRLKPYSSVFRKISLILVLLSFFLQSVYSPSFATEEYKTIEEFLNEYDPLNEYEPGSQLLPKEGDDVERLLDLIFEHFPELTEEQIAQILKECGADVGCWEGMANEFVYQNEEEGGGKVKRNAFRMVWGWIKSGGKFVGDFVGDVWRTFRENGVQGLVDRVKGFFGRVGERVKGFVGSVWDGVKSRSRRVWDGTKGFFGGIGKEAGRFFGGVRGKVSGLLERGDRTNREDKIKELEDRYGIDIEDGTAKWSIEELDWMKDVLETVPSEFYESENLKVIERVSGDEHCGIYNTEFNKIKIYDIADNCISRSYYLYLWQKSVLVYLDWPWLEERGTVRRLRKGTRRLSYKIVLTHELTHAYVNDKKELLDEFSNIAWEKKDVAVEYFLDGTSQGTAQINTWVRRQSAEKGASAYADETTRVWLRDDGVLERYDIDVGYPREDLAEFVAYYIQAPKGLKKNSPNKYDFVEDRIFGKKGAY